jgi:hypothetical protein
LASLPRTSCPWAEFSKEKGKGDHPFPNIAWLCFTKMTFRKVATLFRRLPNGQMFHLIQTFHLLNNFKISPFQPFCKFLFIIQIFFTTNSSIL